ncbi:MAG: hypothetical protein MK312_10840, partial [Roseibacillus sp.]|nr:hypothetical protein [Roseibacillus sp.]
MKKDSSRRRFLSSTTLAAAATTLPQRLAARDSVVGEGPSLEGRIFKAVKGGKQGGETPLQFFERLKKLGFDGVESGNAGQAAAYAEATEKTGVMFHGLVCGWHWGGNRLRNPEAEARSEGLVQMESD